MEVKKIDITSRSTSLDVLRLICMVMITTLHFLGKGGILDDSLLGEAAWFIKSFCTVCVNCFVIISSYYLLDGRFHLGNIVRIWLQTIFYSFTIAIVVFIVRGQNDFNLNTLLSVLLPVITSQFWFVTAYLALYALSPFLNKAIAVLSDSQLGCLTALVVLIFSVWRTIFPFSTGFDMTNGCSIVWFVTLYISTSYVKRHMCKFSAHRIFFLSIYALMCVLVFLQRRMAMYLMDTVSERFVIYYPSSYWYSSFPMLIASFSLFIFFLQSPLDLKSRFSQKSIISIARNSLPVYLIQEHILLREWCWTSAINYFSNRTWYSLVILLICCILLLIILSLFFEFIRKTLFSKLENTIILRLKHFERFFPLF